MLNEDHNISYWLHKALYVDYWNLHDRSRRKEFGSVILLQTFIGSIFTALYYFRFRFEDEFYTLFAFYGLVFVYALVTIVPTIAVHIRRLHDVGKTGWWHPLGLSFIFNITIGIFVIPIVIIYGLFILLFYNGSTPFDSDTINSLTDMVSYVIIFIWSGCVLTGVAFLFFDSEKGPNKWGENPKEDNYIKEIDTIGAK